MILPAVESRVGHADKRPNLHYMNINTIYDEVMWVNKQMKRIVRSHKDDNWSLSWCVQCVCFFIFAGSRTSSCVSCCACLFGSRGENKSAGIVGTIWNSSFVVGVKSGDAKCFQLFLKIDRIVSLVLPRSGTWHIVSYYHVPYIPQNTYIQISILDTIENILHPPSRDPLRLPYGIVIPSFIPYTPLPLG